MPSQSIFPDYIGVAEANRLQGQIEQIAEKLRDREVQFLFGAGMSRQSEIPTGRELAKELLALVYSEKAMPSDNHMEELLCSFPFECIAEAAKGVLPEAKEDLRSKLKNMFKKSKGPHEGHKLVTKFCNDGYIDRIYTTNFDLLFEEEFKEMRCETFTKENIRVLLKNRAQTSPVIPIIHLHGILAGTSQFIITEPDVYDTRDDEWRLLKKEFESSLDSNIFVFIGYSMSDPDFRQIYMGYHEKLKERKDFYKKTYIVNLPKNYYEYEIANRVWTSRDATLFPCDVNDFLEELWDSLKDKAIKALKKTTAERLGYGNNPDAFQAMIERLTEEFNFTEADTVHYMDIMTKGRGRN